MRASGRPEQRVNDDMKPIGRLLARGGGLLKSVRALALAAFLLASPFAAARAETYLISGIPVTVGSEQLTLATRSGLTIVALPQSVEVLVSRAIAIGDAQPGDTIAATGVRVEGAEVPTLDAGETYLVDQHVPDAARKAMALRFLPPLPRADPSGIGFATWSGIVTKAVEGGVEFRRHDGTLAIARPTSDNLVGRLRPGTQADLTTGRLSLFGVGERVTAIVVRVPRPSDVRTLASPQVVAGKPFPTGSTLHMGDDGNFDRGSVPVATSIAGLLLVGDFERMPQGTVGSLAAPERDRRRTLRGEQCLPVHRLGTRMVPACREAPWPAASRSMATISPRERPSQSPIDTRAKASFTPGPSRMPSCCLTSYWHVGFTVKKLVQRPRSLRSSRTIPTSPGEEVSATALRQGKEVPVHRQPYCIAGSVYEVRNTGRTLDYCDESDGGSDADGYITFGRGNATAAADQASTSSAWDWNDYVAEP